MTYRYVHGLSLSVSLVILKERHVSDYVYSGLSNMVKMGSLFQCTCTRVCCVTIGVIGTNCYATKDGMAM